MYLLTVSVLGYLTTKCIISMPFSVLLIVFTDLSTEQVLENLWSPRSWETQASSSGAVQSTCQVRYLINTGDWALPDVYRNNGLYHLFDTVTFSRVIRIDAVFLYTSFQVFYDIDSFLQREFTIHLQVILGLCMCPEVICQCVHSEHITFLLFAKSDSNLTHEVWVCVFVSVGGCSDLDIEPIFIDCSINIYLLILV